MNKKLLFSLLVFSMLILAGCTKNIEDITANDDFVDKKVSVKGTAQTLVKLGSLSGYTLVDSQDDKIIVASSDLPDEGDKVIARGTLKKGLLGLGYYIDTN